jgi:hypothetical protein
LPSNFSHCVYKDVEKLCSGGNQGQTSAVVRQIKRKCKNIDKVVVLNYLLKTDALGALTVKTMQTRILPASINALVKLTYKHNHTCESLPRNSLAGSCPTPFTCLTKDNQENRRMLEQRPD